MHRYRSIRPIIWLKISTLLYLFSHFYTFALIGFAFYAILHDSREIMLQLLYGIILYALCWFLYLWTSSLTNCPLCRSGPMSSKGCAKHRNAKSMLGSYRLMVALSVLFLRRFRCPYCGESTALEVKARDEQG